MENIQNTVSAINQKSNVEFFTYDDDQKLCYGGYCKLRINCLGKYLTVEPLNEDSKPLSASFERKAIRQRKFFHLISENKIQDIILVFKNYSLCGKVYSSIKKYSSNISNNEEEPYQLLIPFLQELQNSDVLRVVKYYTQSFNGKDKAKFSKFLKDNNLYDTVFPVLFNESKTANKSRKRKQQEITKYFDKNGEPVSKKPRVCTNLELSNKRIVKKQDYEFIEGTINGIKKTRLIIFTYGSNRKYCEEFSKHKGSSGFYCCGCKRLQKTVNAIIRNRNKENEYVQILNDEHICEPREYQSLAILERKKILKKPDFEIQKFVKDGSERMNLIVFAPASNAKLCYKFTFQTVSKRFICHHCSRENHYINAKLRQDEDGDDYVELTGEETHICKPRPYITADNNQDIVLKPTDFHFFPQKSQSKLKNVQSRLFIFDEKDRKMGYEFSHTRDDIYQCLGCHVIRKMHKIVTVKLYKIEGTEQYSVRMRPNQKHFCELRKYEPEKWEEKFIVAPMFQFYFKENITVIAKSLFNVAISGQKNQKHPQLLIFTSADKKLCYDYKLLQGKSFHCKVCDKKMKKHVSASVCLEPDGSEYIRLGQMKHECQPVKYSDIQKLGIQLLKSSGLTTKATKIDNSKIVKE